MEKKIQYLGGVSVFFGAVLILLSVIVTIARDMELYHYLNVKEGCMVYGIFFVVLGTVLLFRKKSTLFMILWGVWAYLMSAQLLRFLPDNMITSKIMHSLIMFWGMIACGLILTAVTLIFKVIKKPIGKKI